MLQNSALIPNRDFTFPIRYEGTVLVPSYLIGISLSLLGMKASRKSLLGAFIPNRDFTFPIRYEGTVLVPSYLIWISLSLLGMKAPKISAWRSAREPGL